MPDQLAIYSTIADRLPGDVLAQLAEGAACSPRKDTDGQWYDLAYKTLRVSIRHFHAGEPDFADHIRGFLGYVLQLAEGNMDGQLWEIYYKISKVRQGFGLSIAPDWDEEVAPRLVAALAEAVCGFVFVSDMLTDPWGALLIGPGNERGSGVRYLFDTAKERRSRSNGRLATLGLATPDWLPTTVADEEALLVPAADVARRAIVLMAVAMRADGTEQAKVVKFLQQRGVATSVSPSETAFLKLAQPGEAEMRKLTWRFEALWTLLWALGHVDSVGSPGSQCDARQAIKSVNQSPAEKFIGQARLRPTAEILDELDFYYRAHWHVVRLQQAERPPHEGLDPDVIYERHYALNWLTNYMYQAWDDVTTDT
jgi:Domain of unknown function (DUF4272)